MKRILLLYASPAEVRHIRWPHKFCIGVGAKNLKYMPSGFDEFVLAGCCGALKQKDPRILICKTSQQLMLMKLHYPNWYITVENSIHDKKNADSLRQINAIYVDCETGIVARFFWSITKNFYWMKYIIDYCDRKVMPPGLNHFWRIWQHYRMQKKIERKLHELAARIQSPDSSG